MARTGWKKTRSRRILIVDDEPAVLQMLAQHFRRDGSRVSLASSAEEVRRRGHFHRNWDVVITDIHLPGRSGIELAKQMERRTQSLVLVTGDSAAELAATAMEQVRAGYLMKPFQLFELDAAVELGRRVARPTLLTRIASRLRGARDRRKLGSPEASEAVPLSALFVSIAALLIPLLAQIAGESLASRYDFLVMLAALIPPFLLTYYRGWRGAANALGMGMVVLVTTHIVQSVGLARIPDNFLPMSVAFVATCGGAGWMSSRLHARRREAEELALQDPLTGLPNRSRLMSFLEEKCAENATGAGRIAVVFFDIDHFKTWNDELGHEAGDEALIAFGEMLRTNMRTCDMTARFGGEEFVSVLTRSDYAGALIYAERMRHALTRIIVRGRRMTVSVGVAFYGDLTCNPAQLLAAADAALYEAKAAGRDCVRISELATPSSPTSHSQVSA